MVKRLESRRPEMSNPAFNVMIYELDHGDRCTLLEYIDPDWISHFPPDQPEIGLEIYKD